MIARRLIPAAELLDLRLFVELVLRVATELPHSIGRACSDCDPSDEQILAIDRNVVDHEPRLDLPRKPIRAIIHQLIGAHDTIAVGHILISANLILRGAHKDVAKVIDRQRHRRLRLVGKQRLLEGLEVGQDLAVRVELVDSAAIAECPELPEDVRPYVDDALRIGTPVKRVDVLIVGHRLLFDQHLINTTCDEPLVGKHLTHDVVDVGNLGVAIAGCPTSSDTKPCTLRTAHTPSLWINGAHVALVSAGVQRLIAECVGFA